MISHFQFVRISLILEIATESHLPSFNTNNIVINNYQMGINKIICISYFK